MQLLSRDKNETSSLAPVDERRKLLAPDPAVVPPSDIPPSESIMSESSRHTETGRSPLSSRVENNEPGSPRLLLLLDLGVES